MWWDKHFWNHHSFTLFEKWCWALTKMFFFLLVNAFRISWAFQDHDYMLSWMQDSKPTKPGSGDQEEAREKERKIPESQSIRKENGVEDIISFISLFFFFFAFFLFFFSIQTSSIEVLCYFDILYLDFKVTSSTIWLRRWTHPHLNSKVPTPHSSLQYPHHQRNVQVPNFYHHLN